MDFPYHDIGFTKSITTKTKDGIEVELVTQIVWANREGQHDGVYTKVRWTNKEGESFFDYPRYFGRYGQRPPSLVVFEGLERAFLDIPEDVYMGHTNECLEIFNSHLQVYRFFKPCGKPGCDVCAEMEKQNPPTPDDYPTKI